VKRDLQYFMNLKYDIQLSSIPEEKGGGYEASIPVLGKYTFIGDGATTEEALADLEQTKKETFSSLLKEGVEIPEPKGKLEDYGGKILVRLPKFLHKALVEQAGENGISLNQHISALLSAGVPVAEMKRTLKNLCDLWSSMIYHYEFPEQEDTPIFVNSNKTYRPAA